VRLKVGAMIMAGLGPAAYAENVLGAIKVELQPDDTGVIASTKQLLPVLPDRCVALSDSHASRA
jgi:hypothetical protein